MIVEIPLSESGPAFAGPSPSNLVPLFEAAKRGDPLEPPVQAVLTSLGFSSFLFGMTSSPTRSNEGRFYYSSNASREWSEEYDQQSYIEVDPRVTHCWTKLTPLIWDRRIGGGDPRTEHFLDRSASHGVGSGVAIPLRDDSRARMIFSVHAAPSLIDEATRIAWAEALGDIMLLAVHFHALFVNTVVDRNLEPRHRGAPLSAREKQCLALAARGQTSTDIGLKLAIADRTVNFHFCNIYSKLAVANRQEAIAVAIRDNLITP